MKKRFYSFDTGFYFLFSITIGIIISFRVYFLSFFCFYIDEIYSYQNFVTKGFWATLSQYPYLNNHIFFNLVCALFAKIFSFSPMYTMRLPSLMSGILLLLICFVFIKKYFGYWEGLLAILVIGFLPSASVFSIQGRGYIMQSLFVFVSLFSVCLASKDKRFQYLYILSSVLGFYTIPSFLYPFLAFIVYKTILSISNKQVSDFSPELAILFFAALLYFVPLVVFDGYKTIIESNAAFRFSVENGNIKHVPFQWQTFPAYNYFTILNILALPFYWYWNNRVLKSTIFHSLLIFYASNLIVHLIIFCLQTILIPERTFTYFFILNGLLLAIPLGYYLNKVKLIYDVTTYCILFVCSFFYSFNAYNKLTHTLYFSGYDEMMESAKSVAQKLANKRAIIYSENGEITTMIQYLEKDNRVKSHFKNPFSDTLIHYYILESASFQKTNTSKLLIDTQWEYKISSQNKLWAKVYASKTKTRDG